MSGRLRRGGDSCLLALDILRLKKPASATIVGIMFFYSSRGLQ